MKKYTFALVGIAALAFAFSANLVFAGTSTRCFADSDCPAFGEVCSSSGNCVYPQAASCTSNSQCGYGADCLSNVCTPVTCTTDSRVAGLTLTAPGYSCGSGFTCENPDTLQSSCVANPASSGSNNPAGSPGGPTGAYNSCQSNNNCNTLQGQVCLGASGSALGQCGLPNGTIGGSVTTVLPAADQGLCDDGYSISSNLNDMQACSNLFIAQASALGYSASCTYTVESTPAGSQNPYIYTPSCTVSGSGVLGPITGIYSPQAVVGEQGMATTNSWYLAASESNSGASTSSGGSTAVTGTGSGTTSSGTGTTGSTSPTTITTTTTGPQSAINSSIGNALSNSESMFQGLSAALGSVGLGGGSSAASGSSGTTSGTTSAATGANVSGGTCASTAATTVASSLQTLQGLETVLTSGSVSSGVLTSVQNLINAVAQVLTALSSCISAGN